MKSLFKYLKRFHKDEAGVTLVEYGIALILALAVGGTFLTGLAGNIQQQMSGAGTCISSGGGTCSYGG